MTWYSMDTHIHLAILASYISIHVHTGQCLWVDKHSRNHLGRSRRPWNMKAAFDNITPQHNLQIVRSSRTKMMHRIWLQWCHVTIPVLPKHTLLTAEHYQFTLHLAGFLRILWQFWGGSRFCAESAQSSQTMWHLDHSHPCLCFRVNRYIERG